MTRMAPRFRSRSQPPHNPQHLLQFSPSTVPGLLTLGRISPSVAVEFKNLTVNKCYKCGTTRAFFSGCERTSPSMASSSPPGDMDEALQNLDSTSGPQKKQSRGSSPFLTADTSLFCDGFALCYTPKQPLAHYSNHQETEMLNCPDMTEETPHCYLQFHLCFLLILLARSRFECLHPICSRTLKTEAFSRYS